VPNNKEKIRFELGISKSLVYIASLKKPRKKKPYSFLFTKKGNFTYRGETKRENKTGAGGDKGKKIGGLSTFWRNNGVLDWGGGKSNLNFRKKKGEKSGKSQIEV